MWLDFRLAIGYLNYVMGEDLALESTNPRVPLGPTWIATSYRPDWCPEGYCQEICETNSLFRLSLMKR